MALTARPTRTLATSSNIDEGASSVDASKTIDAASFDPVSKGDPITTDPALAVELVKTTTLFPGIKTNLVDYSGLKSTTLKVDNTNIFTTKKVDYVPTSSKTAADTKMFSASTVDSSKTVDSFEKAPLDKPPLEEKEFFVDDKTSYNTESIVADEKPSKDVTDFLYASKAKADARAAIEAQAKADAQVAYSVEEDDGVIIDYVTDDVPAVAQRPFPWLLIGGVALAFYLFTRK